MTRILAIESSCDETSAAVVEYDGKFDVKSDIIASQIEKHKLLAELCLRLHHECTLSVYQVLWTKLWLMQK